MISRELDVLSAQTRSVSLSVCIEMECMFFERRSASLHLILINIVYQYLFRSYRIFLFIPKTAAAATVAART